MRQEIQRQAIERFSLFPLARDQSRPLVVVCRDGRVFQAIKKVVLQRAKKEIRIRTGIAD